MEEIINKTLNLIRYYYILLIMGLDNESSKKDIYNAEFFSEFIFGLRRDLLDYLTMEQQIEMRDMFMKLDKYKKEVNK